MIGDLAVVLVHRDVVHDRRAIAEPHAEHVGVDDQILLRHLDRPAAVDGVAVALAVPDPDPGRHLLRLQDLPDGDVVGEVPDRPAMLAVAGDALAVVEHDLAAVAPGVITSETPVTPHTWPCSS